MEELNSHHVMCLSDIDVKQRNNLKFLNFRTFDETAEPEFQLYLLFYKTCSLPLGKK